MKQFAVFGNPVSHSLSPYIHGLFAMQVGIKQTYRAIEAPLDAFENTLDAFFASGAQGANITAPFKERAFIQAHNLTERACTAGAVNTLKQLNAGYLLGDNTDGIGLLTDLKYLKFIQPQQCILLVGAGGAAKGVIPSLLSSGCRLTITNRTFSKAQKLAEMFKLYGKIDALALDMLKEKRFNLVINATSSGSNGEVPALPATIFNNQVYCYDMFYAASHTAFLMSAIQQGVTHYADGLGMLVWQAAYAFKLWHGVMPEVIPVLTQLNKDYKKFIYYS